MRRKKIFMKSGNPHKAYCQSVFLLFCIIILFAAVQAEATPPTPPLTANFAEKIEIFVRDGLLSAVIPVQLQNQAKLARGTLRVLIQPENLNVLDPVHLRTEVFKEDFSFREREIKLEREVSFKELKPGTYRLILLVSNQASEEGNISQDIRYFTIDRRGNVLVRTPKEYVADGVRARRERFEEDFRKNPSACDIRLLFEKTVKVPDTVIRNFRRYDLSPEKQLMVRPIGPSKELEGYYREMEDKNWNKRDPITVRGRLVYRDYDGIYKPLVNVSVNLWDDDTARPDEHLGVTVTDWNGNWSFTVNNDDGWWQDGRDIYYSFKLENTRLRVKNLSGIDHVYEWESAVHNDLSDGAVVDFGTETGATNNNAMIIWGHLNLAWNAVVTMSNQDPGFIDCGFPDNSTYWDRFWEEICIEEQYIDGPDVIFHEYGHALMWYAYGEYNNSPGGSHSFSDVDQNSSLAWSEGWATAFALMARPDGIFNWHEGQSGRSIENFSSANRTGELNEGRVAAALLDLFDHHNDDNGGSENQGRNGVDDHNSVDRVGMDLIFRQTIWGHRHNDVLQFWNQLSGELTTGQLIPAREIMNYNWMSVASTSSCAATKVVSAGLEKREDMLQGLRLFRDKGLKGHSGGRLLSRLYYRNSPEMAIKLLKDDEARRAALHIISHFSKLGFVLSSETENARLTMENKPFITEEVAEAAFLLIKHFRDGASPEFLADLNLVEKLMEKVQGMTIAEVQLKLEQKNDLLALTEEPIDITDFNPFSHKIISSERLP